MAVFAGVHQAVLPQSRVETADPRTLHLRGEFIESNLGSALQPDGSVVVRAIGQQYSFTPQCILVPTDTPITFRVTSADVVHGFLITGTSHQPHAGARLHLQHPGALLHAGRAAHAMPRILRLRARRHVGPDQGHRQGRVSRAWPPIPGG